MEFTSLPNNIIVSKTGVISTATTDVYVFQSGVIDTYEEFLAEGRVLYAYGKYNRDVYEFITEPTSALFVRISRT